MAGSRILPLCCLLLLLPAGCGGGKAAGEPGPESPPSPRHEVVVRTPFDAREHAPLAIAEAGATCVVAAEKKLEFNRDIRPILSNNCYLCHGPDAKQRQAGLRLDRREEAIKALESGQTSIVPGDAAKSHLLARINSSNPDEVMPPPASGKSP